MTTALDVQGRRTILYVTNKTGGSVALGDVVVGDASNDEAFTTTTSSAYISSWVGVVIETNGIANNTAGRVCVQGYVSTITCSASVTRGNFIKTHTVAKQGTSAGASRVTGAFAVALTTSATPSAVLFGMPDGSTGAAGSPGVPALTLGTSNSTGAASTLIATDATIAAFDATVPVSQAFGDSAAAGSAGFAARRDHKHGMPAHSYLGYNTVGGSSATAIANKVYWKQVTPSVSGLILGISPYLKYQSDNLIAIYGMIATDTGSNAPNLIVAAGFAGPDIGLSGASGTGRDARWFSIPVCFYATASTAYWIGFQLKTDTGIGGTYPLVYNDGSGTDYTTLPGGTYQGDPIWANSGTITSTSNKYSIRADFLG